MYVCICRAVTMTRVKAAVRAGARTVEEVEAHCGAGGDCGSCQPQIENVIVEAHASCGGDCHACPARSRDTSAPRAA